MIAAGVMPDAVTYSILLDACAFSRREEDNGGAAIHGPQGAIAAMTHMLTAGVKPLPRTYNHMLEACARSRTADGGADFELGLRVYNKLNEVIAEREAKTRYLPHAMCLVYWWWWWWWW